MQGFTDCCMDEKEHNTASRLPQVYMAEHAPGEHSASLASILDRKLRLLD